MNLTPRQMTLSMWANGRGGSKVVLEVPGQFVVGEYGRGWGPLDGPCLRLPVWRPPCADFVSFEAPGPGDSIRETMTIEAKTVLVSGDATYLLWAERTEEHVKRVIAACYEVIRETGKEPKRRNKWTGRWEDEPRFWPLVLGELLPAVTEKERGG